MQTKEATQGEYDTMEKESIYSACRILLYMEKNIF